MARRQFGDIRLRFFLKQASICGLFGSMPAQNARASPAQLVCRSALPRWGAWAEAGAAIAMKLTARMRLRRDCQEFRVRAAG